MLVAMPVYGQQNDLIASMIGAYQQLEYDRAEAFAMEILDDYNAYPIEALTQVHTTLGIIKYAQNNQQEAQKQFEAALSLNPELVLDPALVSPKIVDFFDALKGNIQNNSGVDGAQAEVRYLVLADPRPAAAMRSMVLPGWGQWYKEEKKKGALLMGLWGASAVSTVALHVMRQDAQRSYRRATDPDIIADRYNTYNQRNKLRNGLFLVYFSDCRYCTDLQ